MVTERGDDVSGEPAIVGRVVAGKYAVEARLGDGAMGAVYRARRTDDGAFVALKVLHADVAPDPTYAARFKREAKAASRLDHPNSVRVVDAGEEPDGLLFLAMEYVEGRDLYRVIHEDWPLSDVDIADILAQALAAIGVAHRMGVVHRDLKPENLMILPAPPESGSRYFVKVCDFGIAKILEGGDGITGETPTTEKLTAQGMLIGTPEYMSPEQARGEPPEPRSDLYSLGVILYQLLTGRTPFEGESMLATVLQHITKVPEPPRTHHPDVHGGLEAICLKALSKTCEERYATADAMRDALAAAIDVPSMRARRTADGDARAEENAAASLPPQGKERGWGPLLFGVLVLAVALGAGGWYVVSGRAPASAPRGTASSPSLETKGAAAEPVAPPAISEDEASTPERDPPVETASVRLEEGDASVDDAAAPSVDAGAPRATAPLREKAKVRPGAVKKKRKHAKP